MKFSESSFHSSRLEMFSTSEQNFTNKFRKASVSKLSQNLITKTEDASKDNVQHLEADLNNNSGHLTHPDVNSTDRIEDETFAVENLREQSDLYDL